MLLAKILIGFVVGTLIGMTGVGGGVLLLPVLIFVLRVPPIIAVGSDALFNFVTKIGSSWVHLNKGTVRRKVVLALASGSIPGSIIGVSLLGHLRTVYGTGVNTFITTAIGILLIYIPTNDCSVGARCATCSSIRLWNRSRVGMQISKIPIAVVMKVLTPVP